MIDERFFTKTPGGFQTYSVTSVDDLFCFLRKLQDSQRFIYRGQSNAAWTLETKIERDVPCGYKSTIGLLKCEQDILLRFKRRAHHYLRSVDIPEMNDDVEWSALIQHYGGPTRLLDCTGSIFIGAYFAVGQFNKNDRAAIWAVNHDYMMQIVDKGLPDEAGQRTVPSLHEHAYAMRGRLGAGAMAIEPYRQNRRLMNQQGIFLMPFDINQSFTCNLAAMFRPIPQIIDQTPEAFGKLQTPDDCAVLKFVIDRPYFPSIRRDLWRMNIATETLFPDLDGEARALADIVTNNVHV